MPIGEFGNAPPLASAGSPALTTPMYWMYEMAHASLNPARAVTDATKILFQNPLNPWSHTEFGKSVAAACELFERTTRRYGKPEWGLHETEVNGVRTPVEVKSVWEKPFCRLLHFDRKLTRPLRIPQPRVLIVAPMSGHYATLLRGTVRGLPARRMRSTSPTGPMRAWCRSPRAVSISTTTSTTSSRCCRRSAATCMSSRCASPRCR